ncbi:MAG: hypothetical protein ACOYOI_09890 [Chthoniobacterales bacterium]
MKTLHWTSSSGRIELEIPTRLVAVGYHSGQCQDDIDYLLTLDSIKNQLNKIGPVTLASELKEYGAWDDADLSVHQNNLQRILWLACGDLADGDQDEN